jgi:hypothetical protein
MRRERAGVLSSCVALTAALLFALASCAGSGAVRASRAAQPPASSAVSASAARPSARPTQASRPVALVYRGPVACDGCPEAAGAMLQRDGFEVRYIGPNEALHFSAATLAQATLYVQPGAANGQTLTQGWRQLNRDPDFSPDLVRAWIRGGGHYLGICMGGYLAGDPGLNILPGNTDEFIKTPDADVTTEDDQLVTVDWRGHQQQLYFQDGPYFDMAGDGVQVLAHYTNGLIAAAVAPYGGGRVGVLGPHPEAPSSWYQDYDLPDLSTASQGPADDMVRTLMAKG